ncbi:hypothetical protein GGQ74_002409 [Desulfobaculum xiamenense]|uniref:Lysozyme inhibitor LprI-like N-terminal domain-containing protein n=1 Tax=Desulfobaculum xiamenense TaxID=995050 RepID=A0A846QIP4_9BACT|nr:hypothetical protein [Desulfobaculum xiamenense]
MNRVYRELMGMLGDEERRMLRDAQRSWMRMRDLSFALWSSLRAEGGREGLCAAVAVQRELTGRRAEELAELLAVGRERAGRMRGASVAVAAVPVERVSGGRAPEGAAMHGRESVQTVQGVEATRAALPGRHTLRMQWLAAGDPGEAVVEERDGALSLTGRQEHAGNFVEIEGHIVEVRADGFAFEGTVRTRVAHINGGLPCERTGRMAFTVRNGRWFWRLQAITNPCCGVADYIDLDMERVGAVVLKPAR